MPASTLKKENEHEQKSIAGTVSTPETDIADAGIGPGPGLFRTISLLDDEDWQSLYTIENFTEWGMDVLKNGLRHVAKTALVEDGYICKDHRNLNSQFYSKKLLAKASLLPRLHFFNDVLTADDILLSPEDCKGAYLGYSVIRPVAERCLGRSVYDPTKLIADDNFYALATKFRSYIGGTPYSVSGFPYISQDKEACVCAHSALWSTCRYFSESYPEYGEVYPFDLVEMTGSQMGRTFPYRGMFYADYSEILTKFGVHPRVIYNGLKPLTAEQLGDVYAYVESGFPVMASFAGHVVVLIGHTLDYSRSVKPDQDSVIESFSYVKQFVTVDDNFFPYARLGYCDDEENYGQAYPGQGYSINTIVSAVCPLPEKVFLTPDRARQIFDASLRVDSDATSQEFRALMDDNIEKPWVRRFFITSGAVLKKEILRNAVENEDRLSFEFVNRVTLPHYVWIMELCTTAEYQEAKSSAIMVLDSTANSDEESVILYARVGSNVFLRTEGEGLNLRLGNADDPRWFSHVRQNLRRGGFHVE